MKRITAGILAHVDAGKTTLSEAMLYISGAIKKQGRVDHGDAFLDNFDLERERGITIFSKQAILNWRDVEITLLDTPGHVDFSAETERTIQALDYAMLVISGTDGVQGHAVTLWNLLKRYEVPVFIFVNKMDVAPRGRREIMEMLDSELDGGCVDFSEKSGKFYEDVAMTDEKALDLYLARGRISEDDIRELIFERKVFPCFFGSALKLRGVKEFMDGFCDYIKVKKYGGEFAARVYKVARDDKGVRLSYIKILGGCIKVKGMLDEGGESEKIEQIRFYSGAKYETADIAEAGAVCAVAGPEKTYPGQGLGADKSVGVSVLKPLMTYKILAEPDADMHVLMKNLKQLEEEDPQLCVSWNEDSRELNLRLMGDVQIDVLKRIIYDRFDTKVEFEAGGIVYKETIADAVEGVGHYEPLRHYAEVHLLLEPGEPDSGLVFASDVSEDELDRNWQRLILTHLGEKEHAGVLTGSAITDMKITLIAGKAHPKHTEGGDFRQATYRAVRQGLMQARCVLLEPYYGFRLEAPTECIGRAMSDIQKMGGSFGEPAAGGAESVLVGEAPVSKMAGYVMELNSYTGGRGKLSCAFKGYRPCGGAEEVIKSVGYDPDKDVLNPSGSIFCAHGAGFYVDWRDVKKYMHLDGIRVKEPSGENKEPRMEARGGQKNAEYDDKELEEIFERTFGPIARRLNSETAGNLGYEAGEKKKREGARTGEYGKKNKKKSYAQRKRYLLVDGYNIIFSWEELSMLAKSSLDAARGRLMDMLCNYQGYAQCVLILVFDAYKVKGNPGEVVKYHNIYVIYTKEAETADMYIEKATREIGGKHDVTVATSDSLEQIIVAGDGARRMSAREFKEELAAASRRINEIIEGGF